VGASSGKRMEEGTFRAPMADEARPGEAVTLEAGTEEGAPEAPSAKVAMGQATVSMRAHSLFYRRSYPDQWGQR